jgi:inner membrane protein
MDPLSQAALGAGLSQSISSDRSKQLSALIIGAVAGMAPDLDVFIRSDIDPLLFLEYHRQFTHSLLFIPAGALLCTLFLYPWFKSKLSFALIYLFAFAGYATHGLLDTCTSYGTQLFWPFSDQRFAWSLVSIIDPLFTLPVIILIVLAVVRKNSRYARFGFAYAVLYLALGIIQHQRAESAVYALAQQRGHQPVRVHVKPSFGNRHVWKMIYEYDDRYYVDAAKLLLDSEIIVGDSIQKLDVKRDFPLLDSDSQQAKDIERFRWFSDDYLAVSPQDSTLIMDVRYSFLPNSINFMWGIEITARTSDADTRDDHVGYVFNRNPDTQDRQRFIDMLF